MSVPRFAVLGALLLAASRPAMPDGELNSLNLGEADARNEAYEIMSAAEAQFDCKLEEHSMQGIGSEPEVRYVFHVRAKGAECREALVFATKLAAHDERILFRQLQPEPLDPSDPASPDFGEGPTGPALMPDDQVLIHEVNPDLTGVAPPKE